MPPETLLPTAKPAPGDASGGEKSEDLDPRLAVCRWVALKAVMNVSRDEVEQEVKKLRLTETDDCDDSGT